MRQRIECASLDHVEHVPEREVEALQRPLLRGHGVLPRALGGPVHEQDSAAAQLEVHLLALVRDSSETEDSLRPEAHGCDVRVRPVAGDVLVAVPAEAIVSVSVAVQQARVPAGRVRKQLEEFVAYLQDARREGRRNYGEA